MSIVIGGIDQYYLFFAVGSIMHLNSCTFVAICLMFLGSSNHISDHYFLFIIVKYIKYFKTNVWFEAV